MFVDDCASSYMIVATVANSWFTQDPANVTRFGSSYAGHKLLTKSIKKGFDTILKGIPQHTNNRVRAWFILFTFEFSISMDSKLAVIFFCFFIDNWYCSLYWKFEQNEEIKKKNLKAHKTHIKNVALHKKRKEVLE